MRRVRRVFGSGGGTFVSRSGRVQHFSAGNAGAREGGDTTLSIPEEALPSGETLDRQLEAVTISESEPEIGLLLQCTGYSYMSDNVLSQ